MLNYTRDQGGPTLTSNMIETCSVNLKNYEEYVLRALPPPKKPCKRKLNFDADYVESSPPLPKKPWHFLEDAALDLSFWD